MNERDEFTYDLQRHERRFVRTVMAGTIALWVILLGLFLIVSLDGSG